MRACFSDCVDLPNSCVWDDDRVNDCILAARGVKRKDCGYWRPENAVAIARDILGLGETEGKKCFGMACKGCKDFFQCEEHFPPGCWGGEEHG